MFNTCNAMNMMTKEGVEDAGGEGEQEHWFGEKGCYESSQMENGSQRDCCWDKSVWPTPFTGINPDQNWFDDDDEEMRLFQSDVREFMNVKL